MIAIVIVALFMNASANASVIKKRKHCLRTYTNAKARVNPVPSDVASKHPLVRLALADLGVKAGSSRANEIVKLCGFRSSLRTPWCAAFVSDILIRAGHRIHRTAAVSDLHHQLEKIGRECDPSPSAIVIFRWSHTGVVSRVTESGFFSIEGNSGHRVAERFHPFKHADSFYKI